MRRAQADELMFRLIGFMADLHDCHICGYPQAQINARNGKERTVCAKYGLPIKQVRWNCVDKYQGLTQEEINEIREQYQAGGCALVLEGVAI